MVCSSPAGCSQAREGGKATTTVKLLFCESKLQVLFLLIKLFHNFKIGFLNDKASKVIIFWKINRFLRSRSRLKLTDLIKKWIIIIQPELNILYPYTPCQNSPALPVSWQVRHYKRCTRYIFPIFRGRGLGATTPEIYRVFQKTWNIPISFLHTCALINKLGVS